MVRKQVEILTPWHEEVDDGTTSRWPLVTSEFALAKWQDITGQDAANLLPNPNVVSILAEADETIIAQIAADNRFYVLWEEYL